MIGICKVFDGLVRFAEVIHHALHSPKITMIIGLNFKDIGRINIEVLIGGTQDIALPATIDRDDRAIMGLMIFMCSSIFLKIGPE